MVFMASSARVNGIRHTLIHTSFMLCLIPNRVSKTTTALGHVLFGFESVMETAKRDMNSRQGRGDAQSQVYSEL